MKKPGLLQRLLIAALLVGVTTSACAEFQPVSLAELFPNDRQSKTTLVINKVLDRFHYRPFEVDEAFARETLRNYLEDLDPNRAFFLDSDIQRFESAARRVDDEIERGRVDTAFDIFRIYRARVDSRVADALVLLNSDFDFSKDESYRYDRDELGWPLTEADARELWRQRVKHDFLTLKLSDNSDAKVREQLRDRYEGIARRAKQFTSEDVYQAFMNAYTQTLEPHTGYMSPSTSENFDISMRLSLEGIGAVLSGENEYTVIQRTVPGGPARQSGQVNNGDRIVGVAQGKRGEMEDVIGWRLQDVVKKIRGPKGSVVRLQILPKSEGPGGRTRVVELVRNQIQLEDQAAKSELIEVPGRDGRPLRIGVIEVPAFYRDFRGEASGRNDFTSTTRDVRKLVAQLERQGIQGLVIDLRGNGGGSLTEATSLTGLFIDKGPVVQVRDALGRVEVEEDNDAGVAWAGPMAVLVDRNSASASEIFAGAIQDYGRGVVVGEPTFGKGTVQTLVDLNRYVPGEDADLGRLRLTMAEFFRVNGGSTQLRGVDPDIRFDFGFDLSDYGERALDKAMPWQKIRAARFEGLDGYDLERLRQRSAERTSRNQGFQMLRAQGALLDEIEKRDTASLREQVRREETERRDHILKDQRDAFLRARGLEPVDEDAEVVDDEALERQQAVIDRIQTDEAARILVDIISGQTDQNQPRAAMHQ